ncbi:MAG: CoA transferase [Chloroflexi bacterium]|nr:CoA transferase [Chloroflexota bacterium]
MPGPLSGTTIIDQTQALAGPYCSMILGDLGADVIKIERPGAGDQSRTWGPPFIGEESAYYLAVNRNKRSLALNFTTPEGRAVLYRLIDHADVFMTNLPKLESLQKYQIDYETLHSRNKRLIYAAISGYGHTGPRAGQPGYDIIAQGESGTMALTGDPAGGPTRFPTPIADMTTGLFTLIGILSALHARHTSGQGQFLDVSLFESQMTWLENYAGEYFATGQEPPKRGNTHPQVVPYEPMQGNDDEWFVLGVGSDNIWGKFCELAGLNDLRDDPRFHTNAERVRNREVLLPRVREAMRTRPAGGWLDLLKAAGIPSGPIRNVSSALADPQVAARGVVVELEHPMLGMIKSLATPIHLSVTGLEYRRHPPQLCEHTDEILREFGYEAADISEWRERGVIA